MPRSTPRPCAASLAGETSAFRDIVLLSSAAALVVADRSDTLKDGVATAAQAIDSGRAAKVLDDLVAFSNRGVAP